jgi:acetyltransferase
MWQYADNLRAIYQTPSLPPETTADVRAAEQIIQEVRAGGRTILTETESKQVLAAYGIPTIPTFVATTEDAAAQSANAVGYPVVIKLHSETITHKTDVGGVKLNLQTEEAVREAYRAIQSSVTQKYSAADFLGVSVQPMIKLEGYEIILGASPDPQFGPVLLFGMGGILVEVFKDRALGLPPLNTTLARRMMERTKIYTALKGIRGRQSVDMAALEQLMVRFSQLVAEQKWIKEIDINPLLCSAERILALDARVLLYEKDVTEDQLPRLAIRPYPTQYVKPWTMKNGAGVTIRPIRPEDEPLMTRFHERLSERTVQLRYFYPMRLSQRIEHERLSRITFIDYDREMALVAEAREDRSGEPQIIAAARLIKLYGGEDAEFTILVSDAWQGQGLGSEMLRQLVEIGRAEGLKHIYGDILGDNRSMLRVTEGMGFRQIGDPKDSVTRVGLDL